MTPYQAVQFAAAIYDPIKPGVFSQIIRLGDWIVGVATENGGMIVAIAGSQRLEDFLVDGDFLPTDAGPLGKVHAGFYRGAQEVFAILRTMLLGKVSITGHSLGASRAAILAGLCIDAGIAVSGLFMFEPAKPAYAALGIIIRCHVERIVCTCNARDFVPDLPPSFPFPYLHIVPPVDLHSASESDDPIADHLLSAVIPGVLRMWPPQLDRP